MTCQECDKVIQRYPCSCGYQPKTLAVQPKWIVRWCPCGVAIRERVDQQRDVRCKWCCQGFKETIARIDAELGVPPEEVPA